MANKIWFITGASRGFGYEFAKAALEAGNSVVAIARNIESLRELATSYPETLVPMQLDVTDRKAVFESVDKTVERFGRIDVLISNAGLGHFGSVEELTEQDMRGQMETNFFGSFHVIQAVLPIMRKQNSGHILQVTSMGGITTFMFNGAYSATKWALEGLCETLSKEMEGTGVKVTIIEPGAYNTGFIGALGLSPFTIEPYVTKYDEFMKQSASMTSAAEDPADAAKQVMKVISSDNPPLRLALGAGVPDLLIQVSNDRIKVWEENKN